MPAGPGGHGGSEDRGVPPSFRSGGQTQQGGRRGRRERSPLRTLRGSGRVVPFRRPRQPGSPGELAPRQSRLLVAALATALAVVLVFTTFVLRPQISAPSSYIVLPAAQFRLNQPQLVEFANYPHALPALGTGMYVVRLTSGWEAFANVPPDQVPSTAPSRCTLTWSAQISRFLNPCTGAAWRIDGTPAAPAGTRLADLSAFAVAEQGAFIDVTVGQLMP